MRLVVNALELQDTINKLVEDNFVSCMLTIEADEYAVEPIKVAGIGLDEDDMKPYGEVSCEEVSM